MRHGVDAPADDLFEEVVEHIGIRCDDEEHEHVTVQVFEELRVVEPYHEHRGKLDEQPQERIALHDLPARDSASILGCQAHAADRMPQRRAPGRKRLDEPVDAEDGAGADAALEDALRAWQDDGEAAGQEREQGIADQVIDERGPEPALPRDEPSLDPAPLIDGVAVGQDHHEHIGDLPADHASHGVGDQIPRRLPGDRGRGRTRTARRAASTRRRGSGRTRGRPCAEGSA